MQPQTTNGQSTGQGTTWGPDLSADPKSTPAADSQLSFPKAADRPRLMAYDHYDQLYFGNHYKAFALKAEKGFTDKYAQLRYISANFAGLISRIMADMLFGEKIKFDCEDKGNQEWVDGLIEDNHLIAQLYESELANSRRGDAVFKMRLGQRENNVAAKATVIIEEIPASIYFPELDVSSARYMPKSDVLMWVFDQNGSKYLHKETHRPGYIFHEIWSYDPSKQQVIAKLNAADFGFKDTEETKVQHSLIFHIPNVRDGNFFGTSDYADLEQLFFALNNRITKIDNILDKHSDPILAVPPGVIDEKGQVRKEALNMFEVDNENPGFNKPEYIVWNANMEFAFKEVDKIIDMLYMFSGIAQASTGYSSDQAAGGQAESGRALKFKLLATIRKRNQKKTYYDIVLKEMLEVAMQFGKAWNVDIDGNTVNTPEKPAIDWGDGVIDDTTEKIDEEIKRVEGGLSSRADSIARLDGVSPDDAAKKVKEIDAESAIRVPSLEKPAAPGKPALPAGEAPVANPLPPGAPAVTTAGK
jgi:hypothetical protein